MRLPIASGGFVSAILLCLLAFTAAVPHGKWQKDRGRRMEARDSPPSYYDDPGNTYNPPPPYYGDPGKTYGNPPPYDFGTSSLATISTSNSCKPGVAPLFYLTGLPLQTALLVRRHSRPLIPLQRRSLGPVSFILRR